MADPPLTDLPVLLTKQDVAERWRCTPRTVDRHVADGSLRAIYIGRLVRFRREDVFAAEKSSVRAISSK
jgi:excisionase family DNA binding protein